MFEKGKVPRERLSKEDINRTYERAATLRKNGMTWVAIADMMNYEGFRRASGKKWLGNALNVWFNKRRDKISKINKRRNSAGEVKEIYRSTPSNTPETGEPWDSIKQVCDLGMHEMAKKAAIYALLGGKQGTMQ